MKKTIILFMYLVAAIGALAQTTSSSSVTRLALPNLDTQRTTTIITTTVTTTLKKDTLKYKPPVVVVNPGTITLPVFLPQPIYKASKSINQSGLSNVTFSGLSFDQLGDSVTCIYLYNCKNIHITECRFANTRAFAIHLYNCSNITIDNCFITNVACGGMAQNCTTTKFNNNQVLNINGNARWVGHAWQWNACPASGGNQCNGNIFVNQPGIAKHPHDQISPYRSSGMVGDSIQIIGNIIVGGQINYRPGMTASQDGADGIGLSDQTGNYQVARNNILINSAGIGFQTVGNGIGLKFDHNIIYCKLPATSTINKIGISIQNASQGNYVGYNRVLVYNADGTISLSTQGWPAYWNQSYSPVPQGWSTNKWQDKTIDPTKLLPATIITYK